MSPTDPAAPARADDIARLRLAIRGAVQGVGFRPFVFRLATSLALAGWVKNSAQGVIVEIEGARGRVEEFRERLPREKPGISLIQSIETQWLAPTGEREFEIRPSDSTGTRTTVVLPDLATCPDCLREMFEPGNRRYRYPFTNCTHCGPRFSIIEALPYDRPNTTMKGFTMCAQCRAEYEDPDNRRFHAQPNACPVCGPQVELWDAQGEVLAARDEAMRAVADAIREGKIAAVKGLGGFHLMVAADLEESVRHLRTLKHREEKPLALMYPSLAEIRRHCEVSVVEEPLLNSPQAPIVLLRRRLPVESRMGIAASVAPENPYLGAMLPSTPLHHLLLRELGCAVVATSGNRSDEPICTDEREALRRLGGIADLFLVHNRPIARHVDDSIVRVVAGREMVLRRARGYAPLPVVLPDSPPPALAVGAHLKNAIAVSVGSQAFLSQHIGDLETAEALDAFRRVIDDLQNFYEARPSMVVCDAHPDYLSTQHARQTGLPVVRVQHHYAHVLACLAEQGVTDEVLGVSWDGTGFGSDGTIWGGEFLLVNGSGFERVAHFRTFRLPGGEAAVKEPRRCALGLLFAVLGDAAFDDKALASVRAFREAELKTLRSMLSRGLNSPITSSAGRLFDAIAAIVGLRQQVAFEGQAAMELEWSIGGRRSNECYPFRVLDDGSELRATIRSREAAHRGTGLQPVESGAGLQPVSLRTDPNERLQRDGLQTRPTGHPFAEQKRPVTAAPAAGQPRRPLILDWEPMVRAILADHGRGVFVGDISLTFHNTLVESILEVAKRVGCGQVALTGGCFQNLYLAERSILRLRQAGFRPLWPQQVPPNDGGIALGQLAAVARGK